MNPSLLARSKLPLLVRNRGQLPVTNYSRMFGFTSHSQSFGRYGRFCCVEALLLFHRQSPLLLTLARPQASRRGNGNIYPRPVGAFLRRVTINVDNRRLPSSHIYQLTCEYNERNASLRSVYARAEYRRVVRNR